MSNIFISYRRDDSSDAAGRICDRLQSHFGRDSVFMDVEDIPLGTDFRTHVDSRLQICDAFLAIIGDKWLVDENGPSAHTRIEVAAALAREDVPVIPVLVGNNGVPTADQLPEDVVQLSYRNGISVRSDRSFEGQMRGLIEELEKSVTASPVVDQNNVTEASSATGQSTGWNRIMMSVLGVVVIGLLGVFSANYFSKDNSQVPQNNLSATFRTFNKMPGLSWQGDNLRLKTEGSVCWSNIQNKCEEEGRLYTWVGAKKACEQLGSGWRLPADTEWRELTRLYGGAYGDTKTDTDEATSGANAYRELIAGGESGFEGSLAGKGYYSLDKKTHYFYDSDAVGYYWTSTITPEDKDSARIYTFRNSDGKVLREHQTRLTYSSARCVKSVAVDN